MKGDKRSIKPILKQLTKCQLEHTNQNHIECKQNKCPNQDTEWLNGYKTRYTHCLQETHFRPKTSNHLKVRWYKKMSHANENQNKPGIAILRKKYIDLKQRLL